MVQDDFLKENNTQKEIIYLSIDHLKKGTYNLRITLKEKVIKSILFNRE